MNLVLAKECHFDTIWPLFDFCLKEIGSKATRDMAKKEFDILVKTGFVCFLEEEKKIIGFFLGRSSDFLLSCKKSAHDLYWYIIKSYRSKGYGMLLLRAFEEWAKAVGCNVMLISTDKYGSFGSDNPWKLVPLLEKEGYELFGYQMRRIL